jgi:hypothetical protein
MSRESFSTSIMCDTGRALVAADVRDARLQQRLRHREDSLAVEGLAVSQLQLLDFFLERTLHINRSSMAARSPRGEQENDHEHGEADQHIRYHRAIDVRHGHLGRGDALHRHQQQPVRRQQQPELHADQEQDAEPHRVDAELLAPPA